MNDYTVTYSTFRNSRICFSLQILFNRHRTTFAATRHVSGLLNTPKTRSRSGSASLVYLEPMGTCRMTEDVVICPLGANSAPPNPLAGSEGPLRGGGKRRKEEGRGKERKERNGRDGKNTPSPKQSSGNGETALTV